MRWKVLGIDLTVDPFLVEDDTDLHGSNRGADDGGAAPAEEIRSGGEAVSNVDEEADDDVEDVEGRVMPCPSH